ncbi:ParB N-terminal domain-containing protein [Myxococcus sp. MISCRS1]|jgi:ParB family chromosome partitioning protein|uniref:ParB N-terminal domain-containing protein n=1 Tax=Myxococcus TaxID=32 RepID=UPI001CBFC389|nr:MULTISPECIES: ParB N-terminal domain-containing protein [unclassified Myxococcus]MBZ4408297.1 ParB/RepB/Spo0J family partition protein [Myxococcus sp. XM-1-1-1]MCY0996587.1 ParB N-terminal domain-containing protein [Myxococcus sp. MISCRS1]BDT33395.1 ParB N-terminal domain-containing protein [Myxococcus sp. MH1]
MAAKSARKSAAAKKPAAAPRKPRRKKAEPKSRGLSPQDVASDSVEYPTEILEAVRTDGGEVLGVYRDPLGGHPVVLAVLPIDKVEPTPYQRDLSEPHVKRLASAMERLDRFLDPVIAVRKEGRYWTPNGNHRLHASKLLGAKAIVALLLPDEDVAYQILALNTEKAHNLKERSLEVVRMYRGLVGAGRAGKESAFAHLFEEPAFITLGAAYEKRPRYSAGAYHPFVKAVEDFMDVPLEDALKVRDARADRLLELDDAVVAVVDSLKAKGLQSPYLKNFVVARINFLRFKKNGGKPDFDDTVDRMLASARKFNVDSVKREDIGRMGGGPVEADEEHA